MDEKWPMDFLADYGEGSAKSKIGPNNPIGLKVLKTS